MHPANVVGLKELQKAHLSKGYMCTLRHWCSKKMHAIVCYCFLLRSLPLCPPTSGYAYRSWNFASMAACTCALPISEETRKMFLCNSCLFTNVCISQLNIFAKSAHIHVL